MTIQEDVVAHLDAGVIKAVVDYKHGKATEHEVWNAITALVDLRTTNLRDELKDCVREAGEDPELLWMGASLIVRSKLNALECDVGEMHRRVTELQAQLLKLQEEIEGWRAYKANIDEALNSGNGSYRP